MKYQLIFITLCSIAFCSACNSKKSGEPGNKDNAAVANAPSSSSTGDAVFSYNLDGTKISGGKVDDTQTNNTIWITKNENSDKFSFFLGDKLQDNTSTYAHSLRFAVPGKIGTVALIANDDNKSVEMFVGDGKDDKYQVYLNEDFTVTINNISSTRVSGTFSGKLKVPEGQTSANPEISVTDGKFDIPVRNVGN